MISDKEILSIEDDYDLVSLIGKHMVNSNISFEAKDAIKLIAVECFNLGRNKSLKESDDA